jgi:hypothetical protein
MKKIKNGLILGENDVTNIKPENRIGLVPYFSQYFNNLCTTANGLSKHPYLSDITLEFTEFGSSFSKDLEKEFVFQLDVDENLYKNIVNNQCANGYLNLLFANVFERICVLFNEMLVDFYKNHESNYFIIVSITDIYYSLKEQTITCKYAKLVDKAVSSVLINND